MEKARFPRYVARPDSIDGARPEWFAAFLADRGTRKPSAHTLKAYRQDFDAIAALIAGGGDCPGCRGRRYDRHRAHRVRAVRGNP